MEAGRWRESALTNSSCQDGAAVAMTRIHPATSVFCHTIKERRGPVPLDALSAHYIPHILKKTWIVWVNTNDSPQDANHESLPKTERPELALPKTPEETRPVGPVFFGQRRLRSIPIRMKERIETAHEVSSYVLIYWHIYFRESVLHLSEFFESIFLPNGKDSMIIHHCCLLWKSRSFWVLKLTSAVFFLRMYQTTNISAISLMDFFVFPASGGSVLPSWRVPLTRWPLSQLNWSVHFQEMISIA